MKQRIGALALILGIAACSASDVPLIGGNLSDRALTLADVPGRDEVVRGDTDPAVVTLDLKSSLRQHRLSAVDELPGNVVIPTTNFNAVPITAALQALLSGTDISLSWNTGTLGSRLVTVMNLRGPLSSVVEKVCSAARVFCTYRHGSIELSEKETFVISLPPIVRAISSSSVSSSSSSSPSAPAAVASLGGGSNSIIEAINKLLGDEKATVDEQGGNIMYTATVDVQERVSQYLEELRTQRPLIVLQMYVWEVTLNRENSEGIDWTTFTSKAGKSASLSATNDLSSGAATAGSVSLGAITQGIISASAVASFIATKGRVQTISNPQVTFVSGSTAALKVGDTYRYISQVGTLTTSNVSGTASGTSGNSSTNTVSTDTLDTGLAINVAGSYENGVVFANLDLSIKELPGGLAGLNPTPSGGGTIDLPHTTDEKMNTVLRVRPGDSLVLAGYVTSSDTATSQGLPAGGDSAVPLYGDDQRENRELVMIVKPSIILFSDKNGEDEERVKTKEAAKPLPEAIIIDKSGSQPLASMPPAPHIASTPIYESKDPGTEVLLESSDAVPVENQTPPKPKPQRAVAITRLPEPAQPESAVPLTPVVAATQVPEPIQPEPAIPSAPVPLSLAPAVPAARLPEPVQPESAVVSTPVAAETRSPQPIQSTVDDSLMQELSNAPDNAAVVNDQPAQADFSHAFDKLLPLSRASLAGGSGQ